MSSFSINTINLYYINCSHAQFSSLSQTSIAPENLHNETGVKAMYPEICRSKTCQTWRILCSVLLSIRIIIEYSRIIGQRWKYFRFDYAILKFNLIETVFFAMAIIFMWTGNWYCGICAILHAWSSIPSYIFRLHKGTSLKNIGFYLDNHFQIDITDGFFYGRKKPKKLQILYVILCKKYTFFI